MRRIVLASHGYLADGLKSSAELIVGKKDNIVTICAYVENKINLRKKVAEISSEWKDEDEIIILTDIWGGSVNNEIAEIIMKDHRVHLISGMNLQLLIEILVMIDVKEIDDLIVTALKNARDGMVYYNNLELSNREEEF